MRCRAVNMIDRSRPSTTPSSPAGKVRHRLAGRTASRSGSLWVWQTAGSNDMCMSSSVVVSCRLHCTAGLLAQRGGLGWAGPRDRGPSNRQLAPSIYLPVQRRQRATNGTQRRTPTTTSCSNTFSGEIFPFLPLSPLTPSLSPSTILAGYEATKRTLSIN